MTPGDDNRFAGEVADKYNRIREEFFGKQRRRDLLTYEEARKNSLKIEWTGDMINIPEKPGLHVFDNYDLIEVIKYIDWTFFFFAWKLNGKYPAIFDDPVKGDEARKLFDDAQHWLKVIIDEEIVSAKGVIGIYPSNSRGDDIVLYSDHESKEPAMVLNFLRNQEKKAGGQPNLCLSDYIAPEESGIVDYTGAFVVTAEPDPVKMKKYEDDDYGTIMIRILADRLAESFTELLHEKVRTSIWGYKKDEKLDIEDMLRLKYQGIRPAPGYPACPDHTEKGKIFDLLDAEENIGVTLTESFAMNPPSSVSGYIFAHDQSAYFNVGKIDDDQLADYAERKGMSVEEAARWLSPNL
jgi:5-methyltetrahydrofolate--homocysteine methyltransferase